MSALSETLAGGIRLHIRLSPGAARTQFAGIEADANGDERLKLRISAPPFDGAANAAALAFLAKAFGVAKRQCRLTQGHKSRSNTVEIMGDGAALGAPLAAIVEDATA